MNKLMKLTALILVLFMLPVFAAETSPEQLPQTEQTPSDTSTATPEQISPDAPTTLSAADYAAKIVDFYEANTTLTGWRDVVALYGVGENLENYTLPTWTTESLGENATVTDYAGIIFGLIASGENVHDIWGRDIADELAKMQNAETGLFGTFPNQQIYSMLALDAAKEAYDRDAALEALINTFSTDDGAFGYLPWDPSAEPVITPDVDITAMALLVLDETENADIITSAVTYLANRQLENGSYASWGTENSNTLESVMSTLATFNLLDDSRFIKNETPLIDVLGEYILDDGMLEWEKDSGDANLMATQQGLIAYGDIIAGKSVFLRLASAEVCSTINANVRIEGSAANVLNVPVTVKGYDLNVLDAIKAVLDKNSIPYVIKGSQYGSYISSINSETEMKFGGGDGWLVGLNGALLPSSADSVSLTEGDEILVYYGMFEPQTLIPEYTLSATTFKQNVSFTITVTGTYNDYITSENVTLPIAGATIEVGGTTYTTDDNGQATITPTISGTNTIKISKENAGSFPSIVRTASFAINVEKSASTTVVYPSYSGVVSTPKKEESEQESKEETETTEPEELPFEITYSDKDEISDWAIDGVTKAVQAGLFEGDDSGNINPQDNLSRAELATILLRLTNSSETTSADTSFSDINPDDWFYNAVCTVYELGFMNGVGETSFSPNESVTREQAAVVLARILNLTANETYDYTDADEMSDWAVDAINALTETGIMEGYDGKFNPDDILTREMCAVIMARALDSVAAE